MKVNTKETIAKTTTEMNKQQPKRATRDRATARHRSWGVQWCNDVGAGGLLNQGYSCTYREPSVRFPSFAFFLRRLGRLLPLSRPFGRCHVHAVAGLVRLNARCRLAPSSSSCGVHEPLSSRPCPCMPRYIPIHLRCFRPICIGAPKTHGSASEDPCFASNILMLSFRQHLPVILRFPLREPSPPTSSPSISRFGSRSSGCLADASSLFPTPAPRRGEMQAGTATAQNLSTYAPCSPGT
ncbi:unnamed protein product [Ectocarpus sp. 12 AP-2014]